MTEITNITLSEFDIAFCTKMSNSGYSYLFKNENSIVFSQVKPDEAPNGDFFTDDPESTITLPPSILESLSSNVWGIVYTSPTNIQFSDYDKQIFWNLKKKSKITNVVKKDDFLYCYSSTMFLIKLPFSIFEYPFISLPTDTTIKFCNVFPEGEY